MIYYHKLTVFSHSVKPLSSTPRCALRRGRNAYFKTNDTTNKAYEVLVVGTNRWRYIRYRAYLGGWWYLIIEIAGSNCSPLIAANSQEMHRFGH